MSHDHPLFLSWPRAASLALAAASAAALSLAPRAARADFTTPGARPFTAISSSATHTCAVRSDGQVQCWGSDASGQLGNGMDTQATGPDGFVGMSTQDQPMQRPQPLGTCADGSECPSGQCSAGVCACPTGACPSGSTCSGGTCQPRSCTSYWSDCPWGYTCASSVCTPWAQAPVPVVPNLTGVVSVAAGDQHTCALLFDGTVKCWGESSSGQLGNGTFNSASAPVQVSAIGGTSTPAIAIAAGAFHTCALLADGTVKCWGDGNQGQLGNGGYNDSPTPVQVVKNATNAAFTNATTISAGAEHTCVTMVGGQVYCWGGNSKGQIGNSTTTNQLYPAGVTAIAPAIGYTAIGVAAGRLHTCAQLVSNLSTAPKATMVACWGYNGHGQLGNGTFNDASSPVYLSSYANVRSVAASGDHSCAIFTDGTVKCWGDNAEGQIGNGTSGLSDAATPDTAHARVTTAALVSGLSGARALALGSGHGCAVLADGTVQCWGSNLRDQVGDGSILERTAPAASAAVAGVTTVAGVPQIASGDYHTCTPLASGGMKCWGYNYWGQVGNGASGPNVLTPVAVGGVGNVVSACSGQDHSCALLADGTVKCWGLNNHGQVGNGTSSATTPVTTPSLVHTWALGILNNVVQITCAGFHTCALLGDGTARCWGADDAGQLGNGGAIPGADAVYPTTVTTSSGSALSGITEIVAGLAFNCAITQGGSVSCWGANSSDQLGYVGSAASTPVAVNLTQPAKSLALGGYHACVVLADGSMQCWGSDSYGQLGDNRPAPLTPTPANVLSLGGKVLAAGGGAYHTCSLMADSSMRCWGNAVHGQLGNGSPTQANVPQTVDWSFFGTLYPQTFATAIGTGGWHACAATYDGSGRCWGYDYYGELGNGSTGTSPNFAYFTAQYVSLP